MRAHTYIQLRHAGQDESGPGFHVEVSDDYNQSTAGFLKHDALPQEAVMLAAWCFQQPEAAAILQAAIARDEPIGTTLGEVLPVQVLRQLAMQQAQQEHETLEETTAAATGHSKGPRL